MAKRKFKITQVEVGSWSTSFSITDMDHANSVNSMSPEAFFHHIGGLCGLSLGALRGFEFTVTLPGRIKSKKDDPLTLCGKTIGKDTP